MLRCFRLGFMAFLLMSVLLGSEAEAQQLFRFARGGLVVWLEPGTGRFSLQTADSTNLLFIRDHRINSFTNVRINDTVYTNNVLPSPPAGTTPFPKGTITMDSTSILFVTDLPHAGDAVQLRQRFTPDSIGTRLYLRLRNVLVNNTGDTVRAGLLHVLDLMIGDDDSVEVYVNGLRVAREREFRDTLVPPRWTARSMAWPFVVHGVFDSAGARPPDQFVVGRWRSEGYVGAATWDYQPSGLELGDNAVLMQWNRQPIASGDSLVITVIYSVEIPPPGSIQVRLECPGNMRFYLDRYATGYLDNPRHVANLIRNVGLYPASGLSVRVTTGPWLVVDSGSSAQAVDPRVLRPGRTAANAWRLRAVMDSTERSSWVRFDLRGRYGVRDSCVMLVHLPAGIFCDYEVYAVAPDSVRRLGDLTGYDPNPVRITAFVLNRSSFPLSSVKATLHLPPRLRLLAGDTTQHLIEPLMQIYQRQKATATWMVGARFGGRTDTVTWKITFSGMCVKEEEIEGRIIVGGVTLDQPDAGKVMLNAAWGREFWFAYPTNRGRGLGLYSTPYLRILTVKPTTVFLYAPAWSPQWWARLVLPANVDTLIRPHWTVVRSTPYLLSNNGVVVKSTEPIALEMISYLPGSQTNPWNVDASMILPLPCLGTRYMAVGYDYNEPIEEFIVASGLNKTAVYFRMQEVTPEWDIPWKINTYTMDRGAAASVRPLSGRPGGGLLGVEIRATAPVYVSGGTASDLIKYPGGLSRDSTSPIRDMGFHQMLPENLLGKAHVALPFRNTSEEFMLKIVATEDSTIVWAAWQPHFLWKRGDFLFVEFDEPTHVTGNKPIVVVQMNKYHFRDDPPDVPGDFAFTILPPANRWPMYHDFSTAVQFFAPGSRTYLNLAVHGGGQDSVRLDGKLLPASTFRKVLGASFYGGTVEVTPGRHRVETTDPRGVSVIAYGHIPFNSFAFCTGIRLLEQDTILTDIPHQSAPRMMTLDQNYPNPFGEGSASGSPETVLRFTLPAAAGNARLEVFNVLGRRVAVLWEGPAAAGTHTIPFDAAALPGGVYICRLQAGNRARQIKMLLIR
ncbi:MAG: T9SS type A sorting domain-containing protein [Chlorobi bacterium]|nr:T9SS type A sorting domain-containing protein [Chlorobiota bacterium]